MTPYGEAGPDERFEPARPARPTKEGAADGEAPFVEGPEGPEGVGTALADRRQGLSGGFSRRDFSPKPLSDNARKILAKRYLKRNESGEPMETPEEMFRRVARTIAAPDGRFSQTPSEVRETEERFYRLLTSLDFMPNSPTLMNAGRPLGQLSACFVLPVGDSMEEIFDALKFAAVIHKSGGGTGFSFSRLRPRNDVVNTTMGVSSGPVSFMTVFNHATEAVKQGGTRRGANMGILRIDHPDILDFISCKQDTTRITNFNISVALTDAFMEAVEKNQEYELVNPRTRRPAGLLHAREVFQKIVHHAWSTGEPGIVFIDRINQADPLTPVIGEVEATNPCGEQPLHPFDSCNLGSVNLAGMALPGGAVDWGRLREVVRTAVHFLDNVIEANNYPLPQVQETTRANRKIGLGVMGWADLLYDLEVPYDSPEAVEWAEQVMGFIQTEGHKMSEELALMRGPFPRWEGSRPHTDGKAPRRNATITTIAPTGTISIIADASGGIEPVFALAFVRNQAGMQMTDVNARFAETARREGFYSEDLMKKIAVRGTARGLSEVPEKWQKVFATAHDITPEWHIRMQAAFQKGTDNAVSKTCNFPREATPSDIEEVYRLAYRLDCKGVTVYRDGSREGQVLSVEGTHSAPKVSHAVPGHDEATKRLSWGERLKRPEDLPGITKKIAWEEGHIYLTMNYYQLEEDRGRKRIPFEIFVNPPARDDAMSLTEDLAARSPEDLRRAYLELLREHDLTRLETLEILSRLSSIGFQHGVSVETLLEQVEQARRKYRRHISSPTAIYHRALRKQYMDSHLLGEACPDCGAQVEFAEGCLVCTNKACGFSKCS